MTTILVTGAARGIGHALVTRAIARGDTVFAVVRKKSDTAKFKASPKLHIIEMDVTDTDAVERGYKEVDKLLAGKKLDVVISNAAISYPGSIELTTVEEYEHTMNTNFLGYLRMLKFGLPRLRGHGGRMIMVTSLWGRASGAMLGAYAASKHAIESLADTARRETSGMGLDIIIVEPGVIRTDMYYDQGPHVQKLLDAMSPAHKALYGALYARYRDLVGGASGSGAPNAGITAEQCAADIEQAVFDPKPRTRYRSGKDAKIVVFLNWLLSDRRMDALLLKKVNNKPL